VTPSDGSEGPAGAIAPGTVVRAPVPPGAGPLNIARACLEVWALDPRSADRPAFTFLHGDRIES